MNEVPLKKVAVFLVCSVLLISFSFYAYQIIYMPNILVDREDRLFVVKKEYTYRRVQEELGKNNFVNDMVSFSFLAKLAGYDKEVQPGRYVLRKNMTNLQAIKVLKSGRQEAVKITFTHVRLLKELGDKITKNTGLSGEEFDDALATFVDDNNQGFTKQNVIAMFIPNTYEVYFNLSPDDLVERMNTEYKKFWNKERLAKAEKVGFTPIEVSILASIVQAETVKKDEAPIIAGLYINRLKKGMPLQADPTLVFASGDFALKRVLNVHKEIDSPYNTYKYAGLPPGPINLPQVSSIDAVLNYKEHDYRYMCAKEDFSGYHNFAATLDEHSRNAKKYQTALSREMKIAQEKNK
jgi:UPF0755 protein